MLQTGALVPGTGSKALPWVVEQSDNGSARARMPSGARRFRAKRVSAAGVGHVLRVAVPMPGTTLAGSTQAHPMESATRTNGSRRSVVFDMGGVLLQWNPRFLYRKLFPGDEQAMEDFLATVCTREWNERQDAGRPFAAAIGELVARHADKAHLIEAFRARFDEMIPGAIDGTVEILLELARAGVPLYALTNFSAETFPAQRDRFPFMGWAA